MKSRGLIKIFRRKQNQHNLCQKTYVVELIFTSMEFANS